MKLWLKIVIFVYFARVTCGESCKGAGMLYVFE